MAARGGRAAPGQPPAGDAPAAGRRAPRRGAAARGARRLRFWRVRGDAPAQAAGRAAGLAVALPGPAGGRAGRARRQRARGRATAGWSARGSSGRRSGSRCACSRCPATIVSIAALEGVGAALRALPRRLLRTRVAEGGPVRELLAERLGDRSLKIAYWLPEREIFVDDAGRQVELPDPGSGRAWTAVDRGGVRLAAIVHDAELDASPELVTAAASAAALAIDNERLKAELRARVEELRVSRLRIVEAADDARRRIERDLHDGAQQQLVSARAGPADAEGAARRLRAGEHGRRDRREARGRARRAARVRARHPSRVPVRARRRRRGRGARGAGAAQRRGRRSSSTSACPRRSRPPPTSWSPRG